MRKIVQQIFGHWIFMAITLITLSTFTGCTSLNDGELFWVEGTGETCDAGAAKIQCYLINRSKDPNTGEWEYFYSSIDGFEIKQGVRQLIRVRVDTVYNPPADGSSLKYTLLKVVKTQKMW
ncbi:DUF4377 domain-containing protein [Aureitalea marina]|uniref:DUF4377 domain-containing protein n=1 Tax=Aureitalea marina TaxID=930804 RepID=A0A2S7KM63_9FLAO|nr:DUF4377 domain-containing protein [Aureitalea marina]PQB03692.1 hypothetical protein BST85_01330 [Aureitalea marina]